MTLAECVIDASTLLRGLLCEAREAEEILRRVWAGTTRAHAPDLIVPESTHALVRLVRAGRLDLDDARRLAGNIDRAPLEVHSGLGSMGPALELARARSLSGYDAFYAVLSDVLELPLVTADRTLAAAVGRAVLVT